MKLLHLRRTPKSTRTPKQKNIAKGNKLKHIYIYKYNGLSNCENEVALGLLHHLPLFENIAEHNP